MDAGLIERTHGRTASRAHGRRRGAMLTALLGLGLLCQPVPARASEASDEAVVRNFYQLLTRKRDAEAAFAAYIGPDFIEHSGDVPGGNRAGALAYMKGLLARSPQGRVEVVRAASDKGLVFLHARFTSKPDARPVAIVEIFRVSGGRIVEHWDVIAPTPAKPVNPLSPF